MYSIILVAALGSSAEGPACGGRWGCCGWAAPCAHLGPWCGPSAYWPGYGAYPAMPPYFGWGIYASRPAAASDGAGAAGPGGGGLPGGTGQPTGGAGVGGSGGGASGGGGGGGGGGSGGGGAPGSVALPATIALEVPEGAEVYIDGNRMRSASARRVFVSPPLEPGRDYFYRVRVVAPGDGGRTLEETQKVYVRAGGRSEPSFASLPGGRPALASAGR